MAAKFSLGSIQLLALKQQLWRVQRHLSKRLLLLEFTSDSLVVAQFQVRSTGLKLCGFARESLPSGAVERGVPTDPPLMAELITSLCKEQLLVAHRAMVVLPPEAVHCSSHWLPSDLDKSELQQTLLQPAPPVLLPFPLGQTDFDVLSHGTFSGRGRENQQLWTILAVASRLSDRLLQCLQLADQECTRIELSSLSLSRLAQPQLASLKANETALILDFECDQTHVVVASSDGPLFADRLTAIRAYPHGEPDVQENYMPLSEIDLQAFIDDLNHLIEHLQNDPELPQIVSKVVVAGANSAHPNLIDLLNNILSISVVGINLFENPVLDGLDQLALTESCFFHRIVGAAMALVKDLSSDYASAEIARSDEVVSTDLTDLQQTQESVSSESIQPLDESNLLLESAMYSDLHSNFEDSFKQLDVPSSSATSGPDVQPEQIHDQELEKDQEKHQNQVSPGTSFQQALDGFPSPNDGEPLLLPDVKALPAPGPPTEPEAPLEVIPTDDPTTWPSVGKRRRRTSRADPSPAANVQPATPWQASNVSDDEDSTDSNESSLFSFGGNQAALGVQDLVSSDKLLIPEPESVKDAQRGEDAAGSGLFSFASDTNSSPELAPKDVIDESQSDSDYSLGLGDP